MRSSTIWKFGSKSPIPKRNIRTIDNRRKISADTPKAFTTVLRKRVKKVKLKANPATTPKGLLFPPVKELDSTTGRMGKMQGERIVTKPPKKANIIRSIILLS